MGASEIERRTNESNEGGEMTQEDIIRLAREAGWRVDSEGEVLEGDGWHIQTDIVEHFAELVAAAQPKREWVGLTDEEIAEMHHEIKVKGMGAYKTENIYRAIEARLKERNT